MSVQVIVDDPAKIPRLHAALESHHPTSPVLLGELNVAPSNADVVVVAADLRLARNIAALKSLFQQMSGVKKRVFLIDQRARLAVVQACALGATKVLPYPARQSELLAALSDWDECTPGSFVDDGSAEDVAASGAVALTSMFSAVIGGQPIDIGHARIAAGKIADSIADDGLTNWLDTVRRHHEGTYQHCLLVTGIAIDFGLSLGLSRADVERLSSAAIFHDIGKARIPLAVLDKPGRLDPDERLLIETHPAAGFEILKDTPGISAEILDAVRHHHEYLDGSGYPDGLCEGSIADVVRILTISDIFAALIEQRQYKPPMHREQAYNIICGMRGKLESALVVAFKDVALSR